MLAFFPHNIDLFCLFFFFLLFLLLVQASSEMTDKGALPQLVDLLSSNDEELLTDLVNLTSNIANQGTVNVCTNLISLPISQS